MKRVVCKLFILVCIVLSGRAFGLQAQGFPLALQPYASQEFNFGAPFAPSTSPFLYGGLNITPGYMGGMMPSLGLGSLLSKSPDISYFGFPTTLDVYPDYTLNETDFSYVGSESFYDEVTRGANPVSDWRRPNWINPLYPINQYGLADAFFDPLTNCVLNPFMHNSVNSIGMMSGSPYTAPGFPFGQFGPYFQMGFPQMPILNTNLNPFGFGGQQSSTVFQPSSTALLLVMTSIFPSVPVVAPPVNPIIPPPVDLDSEYHASGKTIDIEPKIYILILDGEEYDNVYTEGILCNKIPDFTIPLTDGESSLSLYRDIDSGRLGMG